MARSHLFMKVIPNYWRHVRNTLLWNYGM